MRIIEKPSTIGLPPPLDDLHGIPDALVRLIAGVPEVVKRTEDIIVVSRRERELQERRVRDFARREPSKERALEQVLLAAPAALRCDLQARGPTVRSYSE